MWECSSAISVLAQLYKAQELMSQQQEHALGSTPTWAEQTGEQGMCVHSAKQFTSPRLRLVKRPTGAFQMQQVHLTLSPQHQVFIYKTKYFAKDLN